MKCEFCRNYIYSDNEKKEYMCNACIEHTNKLSRETVDWLVRVIDGRIEEEMEKHNERYGHESKAYY